ncbi:fumarylacetoacetate hydrolase [Rhodoplanes elegans]|uniref:Fumarylacetoacetate hydrolase n=1 Tax=Rhodoplanes elegans TaxID=29408 RepID=A0A327KT44_9BRAD|nr:fumarylacetoacetate hydrolase family protein [Rhodoplanes elegans]MBK5962525.1 fumarylacetoacetate hydrolase [Rhodoplanes elegans]RAI41104.1 fumarylacetoacetate hydrolase [Rhodoplanes elegans]
MRFVTFEHGGTVQAGMLTTGPDGDTVLALGHPAFRDVVGPEPNVIDLIRSGLDGVETRIAAVTAPADAHLPLSKVRLLAPFTPGHIIGAAHNFRDAVAERKIAPPEKPVTFVKEPSAVAGPTDAIVVPPGIGGVTYEAELAVVIGRRAEAVAESEALSYVAGYCVLNDVSASDVIKADGHFRRGKNFPTFCPMGPALVSASEVPDPQNLRVWLAMDGVTLQDGTTADMLFSVATLISVLSALHPLEPGDVIATGTPAGVAPMRTPPTWLRPGAVLETEVEGLGRLVNPIVEQ